MTMPSGGRDSSVWPGDAAGYAYRTPGGRSRGSNGTFAAHTFGAPASSAIEGSLFTTFHPGAVGGLDLLRRGAVRRILRALAANQAVAVLIDQHIQAADAIYVDFFNRPAADFDARRYFRGTDGLRFYNIGAAATRGLARSIVLSQRGEWTVAEGVLFAQRMIVDPHLEVKSVGIEVLARYRREGRAVLGCVHRGAPVVPGIRSVFGSMPA